MKLFLDFLPIIAFVAAYFISRDIYYATTWLIGGSAILVAGNWFIFRKVDKMHLFTFILLLLFGGATLLFREPRLIQWKPTIATWVLATVCFVSKFVGKEPLVEKLMGSKIELPRKSWHRMTDLWVGFFFISGATNLYVFMQYSESFWVAFKLYGQLSLTLVFVIVQGVYITLVQKQMSSKKDTQ